MPGDSALFRDNRSRALLTSPALKTHQSDLELAAAILARDRKATARLVEIHSDTVHRYVWRRLAPNVEMVEDLVQEVFIAAWRSLKNYSGEASLQTWLLGIARNKVEDHYRGILSRPLADLETAADEMPASEIDLEAGFDAGRQSERAAEILMKLPYEYAAALRWRYWENRSAREMAAASGRTEKAVERLLARARQKFKRLWLEMGLEPEGRA